MTLADQQAFARAIQAEATRRECTAADVVLSISLGWMYFDGTQMREPAFVAVTPDAARRVHAGGTYDESEIVYRFPAPAV